VNFNFSQVAAARKLGTTQASISHYLSSKRGDKMVKQLKSSAVIRDLVAEIAEGIADEKISSFDALLQFCKVCEALKSGELTFDWEKSALVFPEIFNICSPTARKD
jgi:predicted transcriptional regulator